MKIKGILAVGPYKSFMFLEIKGKIHKIFIPRETYYALKDDGIQTGQARRWQKGKTKS